MQSVK